jgi:hypothetical protein
MSLPGAPDSVDTALQAGSDEFWNSAMGELWGRTLFGAPMTSLSPYRRAVTPESAERMREMSARIRGAYEQIGGAKLVEDVRARWNPGRFFVPLETELNNTAVVKRLVDAGLDPKKAREVALSNGLKPSEIDHNILSRWWQQVGATKVKPDEAYERTTATLLQAANMKDFGTSFARALPPEDLGKAINLAVWKRYDTLTGARTAAMNTIDERLPPDLLLDMTGFKQTLGVHPGRKMGGVFIRPPSSRAATRHPAFDIAYNLPDHASFKEIETTRTAIATMLRDQRVDKSPAEIAELEKVLANFDDMTAKAMPTGHRANYRRFARADNERNRELYDAEFVAGLLVEKPTLRIYAQEIIDNKDIDSFRQLEKVLAKHPDGKQIIGSLKSAISEKFMVDAAPNGIIDPDKLIFGLGSQEHGYGKAFLDVVLGPQYGKNYKRYMTTMQEVNQAASNAGATIKGVTTMAGLVAGVKGLFRGAPGMTGSAFAAIATALFAPKALEIALTSPYASRLLLKTAENVATGRNPMKAGRLAGRVLEEIGYAPEDFAKELAPPMGGLVEPPPTSWRQPGIAGSAKAPIPQRDPAVPIGQTLVPNEGM